MPEDRKYSSNTVRTYFKDAQHPFWKEFDNQLSLIASHLRSLTPDNRVLVPIVMEWQREWWQLNDDCINHTKSASDIERDAHNLQNRIQLAAKALEFFPQRLGSLARQLSQASTSKQIR